MEVASETVAVEKVEVVLADGVVEEDDGDGGDATAVVTECTTTA